jgi:hypothetical protein
MPKDTRKPDRSIGTATTAWPNEQQDGATGTNAPCALADQLEIQHVVWSLGRCLDERDFEALRDLFTSTAIVATRETAHGHDAIVDHARRRHSADATIQHVISNLIVEGEGDELAGRANLLVSFARNGPQDPAPLLIGEVYRFTFQHTPRGWCISSLTSTRSWTLTPQPS